MAPPDTRAERIRFQNWLDDTFPDGAWAVMVTRDEGAPTGVEITTGRIFVQEVKNLEGVWLRGLLLDPVSGPPLPDTEALWTKPWDPWIRGALVEDEDNPGVWEAEIVTDDDGAPWPIPVVIRINTNAMVGERKPTSAQKRWATEKWETELFPNGLSEDIEEAVSV